MIPQNLHTDWQARQFSSCQFNPAHYHSDEELTAHILSLSRKKDYDSLEELMEIAEYIQAQIAEPGKTASHLSLVNAILSTGMPFFNYPKITKALEKAVRALEKSSAKTRMELAQYYRTLWQLTLKPTYLDRFEKTVKHCYFTLASDRNYPGLGVDKDDSRSLTSAIRFLDENRQTLWVLNDRYDVDKVIKKYRACV